MPSLGNSPRCWSCWIIQTFTRSAWTCASLAYVLKQVPAKGSWSKSPHSWPPTLQRWLTTFRRLATSRINMECWLAAQLRWPRSTRPTLSRHCCMVSKMPLESKQQSLRIHNFTKPSCMASRLASKPKFLQWIAKRSTWTLQWPPIHIRNHWTFRPMDLGRWLDLDLSHLPGQMQKPVDFIHPMDFHGWSGLQQRMMKTCLRQLCQRQWMTRCWKKLAVSFAMLASNLEFPKPLQRWRTSKRWMRESSRFLQT